MVLFMFVLYLICEMPKMKTKNTLLPLVAAGHSCLGFFAKKHFREDLVEEAYFSHRVGPPALWNQGEWVSRHSLQ